MFEVRSIQIIFAHPSSNNWILGKIARKIKENFEAIGLSVEILNFPTGKSDVVFWIGKSSGPLWRHFLQVGIAKTSPTYETRLESVLVTHIDDLFKVQNIKNLHKNGDDLVFMSNSHADLVANLAKISPRPFAARFGSDFAESYLYERFVVGIFSKVYPDGRKNEDWLVDYAKNNSALNLEFLIIGAGWTQTVKRLRALGVLVRLYDGVENSYPAYESFPDFYRDLSLYIYLGFDEGAMGCLDAYILGVPLLISKQGFHLDFQLAETDYFTDYKDFENKLNLTRSIYAQDVQKKLEWTWEATSRQLLKHWGEVLNIPDVISGEAEESFEIENFKEISIGFWLRLAKTAIIRFLRFAILSRLIRQIKQLLKPRNE
jgi:hypothetical protein